MPEADVSGELEALALAAELEPMDTLVPVEVPVEDEALDEEEV